MSMETCIICRKLIDTDYYDPYNKMGFPLCENHKVQNDGQGEGEGKEHDTNK